MLDVLLGDQVQLSTVGDLVVVRLELIACSERPAVAGVHTGRYLHLDLARAPGCGNHQRKRAALCGLFQR